MGFSTQASVARSSRYTLADSVETAEGGRAGVGVDRNGNEYLVHEIGRTTEAVALHAVASAVAGGAIPPSAVVAAFAETGKLAQLKSAITRHDK